MSYKLKEQDFEVLRGPLKSGRQSPDYFALIGLISIKR